jgi:DNA-binding response OmpR family regulator
MYYSTVILITKDDNLSNLLSKTLERKGIHLITLKDELNVALEIRRYKPQVIMVDIDLEEIDSQYLCKDIHNRFSNIPIIIITGNSDISFISNFLSIPVYDFIQKPINPDILYLRLKLSTEERINDTSSLKVRRLEIDDKKKVAKLNKKELKLTPREYDLLKYLVKNKGRVLPRESILNHVWGYNSHVIDRNVDVYIGYLREKIDSKDRESYIKTVNGFGYMLVEE